MSRRGLTRRYTKADLVAERSGQLLAGVDVEVGDDDIGGRHGEHLDSRTPKPELQPVTTKVLPQISMVVSSDDG